MALVVFLRGINVGGRRTFRPTLLAKQLSHYGVVNVGAAGTFVVRKPGPQAKFRAELLQRLPFKTAVAFCQSRDVVRLEMENPFGPETSSRDIVPFVSILSRAGDLKVSLPVAFPAGGKWFVRVLASQGRFVFGLYRRHMKTISYLSQIDTLFRAPATTRSWKTILAVVKILEDKKRGPSTVRGRPDPSMRH